MARRYAPALTRQQFKAARPDGNYIKYLNFLDRKRPGWDMSNPLKAQRVGPPKRGAIPTYETLLRGLSTSVDTPAMIQQRANQMAAQQMNAQKKLLQWQYDQAQKDALLRQRSFAASGMAAAAMNKSLIGLVGAGYQSGADELSAMGSGLSAQAAGATQGSVDAAAASAGNVGMAGPSVGGPIGTPGIAGATQAGVENYRGAALPAEAMTNAGGYAQAGMAGQIAAQNLRADQESKAAYLTAMREASNARNSAMKELVLGRPKQAADFLAQLQAARNQQIALAMSLIQARNAKQQQGFENTQTVKEGDRAERELQAKLDEARRIAKAQGREIDENRSLATGVWTDKKGRVIKKNGKPIKVPEQFMPGYQAPTTKDPRAIRTEMADAADKWLYRHMRKGVMTGTKQQLIKHLLTLYPGNVKIAQNIAESVWPTQTSSSPLPTQPGKQ